MPPRRKTRQVTVGTVRIGGDAPETEFRWARFSRRRVGIDLVGPLVYDAREPE
jgi:hypothetical protein